MAETFDAKVAAFTQPTFDIYKLEYEKCAERYENIYKGIWQNFSYMAALSAGIVSFGARALDHWLKPVAVLPLLFWYFATYVPMDSYARQARRRAAEIEDVLNKYFLGLTEPIAAAAAKWWTRLLSWFSTCLFTTATTSNPDVRRIQHYRKFGETHPRIHIFGLTLMRAPHVSVVVHLSMWALLFYFVEASSDVYHQFGLRSPTSAVSTVELRLPASSADSAHVEGLIQTVKQLQLQSVHISAKLDSISRSIPKTSK